MAENLIDVKVDVELIGMGELSIRRAICSKLCIDQSLADRRKFFTAVVYQRLKDLKIGPPVSEVIEKVGG